MASEDYDRAATYISTFLELEDRLSAAAQVGGNVVSIMTMIY